MAEPTESQTFGGERDAPCIKWTTPFRRRCANLRLLLRLRPSATTLVRIYVVAAIPCATTLLLMDAFLPNIVLPWTWLWFVLATPIVLYAFLLVLDLAPDRCEIKQAGIVHTCGNSHGVTRWEDLVGFRVEEDKAADGLATMVLYHKDGRRDRRALPEGDDMVAVIVEVTKRIPLLDVEPPPPKQSAVKPISGSALFIMYLLCHVYALGVGYLMIPYMQWRMEVMLGILLLGPGTVGAALLCPRQLFHPKDALPSGLYHAIVALNMIGSLMTMVFGGIMWLGMMP